MIEQWREALLAEVAPGPVQVWFALHGSESDKRSLAVMTDIVTDAALLLLDHGNNAIWNTLFRNRTVAPEVLALALSLHPEFHDVIALNPAAPVHAKLNVRLGEMSGAGIERFLRAVRASVAEADQLFARHADVSASITLGEAWKVIRSISPGDISDD